MSAVSIQLNLAECSVRSWRRSDEDSLLRHANNRNIWINLRDGFPHPYTREDARDFLGRVTNLIPQTYFAITIGDVAIGAIGFGLRDDVERCSAEIGYWLGEEFWGRGITTAALRAVTQYAIRTHDLARVYAVPYEWNVASFRVLEKAGYVLEGRMRRSAIKDGKIIDQLMYAFVSQDWDRIP